MSRMRPALLAALALGLATGTASAQDRFNLRRTLPDTTTVTVSFNYPVTVGAADTEAEQTSMAEARKRLYQIADAECRILLATIASTCRLQRANVRSTLNRRSMGSEPQASLSMTATYQIELKPEI